jgi:pathogenesis-related protein 1
MSTTRCCLGLLLMMACGTDEGDTGSDASDGDGASNEPAELSGITAAHNRVRAEVGVPALRWNADLAGLAAQFIADCQFEHSSGQERSNVFGFDYVGENLYQAGGFTPSGAEVSDTWASEEADYNYANNSCRSVCGHYTQQVWRTTTDLGCAMKMCGGSVLVACEYGPGGNYQGERPY